MSPHDLYGISMTILPGAKEEDILRTKVRILENEINEREDRFYLFLRYTGMLFFFLLFVLVGLGGIYFIKQLLLFIMA
jgi:hypothetical protein